jgi:hypothetical protein
MTCFFHSHFISKEVWEQVPINGNNIESKAEQSFDLGFIFYIKAKQTCLFQNL